MVDPAKSFSTTEETTKPETESATTTHPPSASDDVREPPHKTSAFFSNSASDDPPPPAKPPRPLSPRQQAEKTLTEAFPSIDVVVVKAILSASGGDVEPAFDALLSMTDPESQKEAPPPIKPPRPAQQIGIPTSTAQSQLEADEMYARQLHDHYSGASRNQRQNPGPNQQAPRQRNQAEEEREYSFIDDELPMIRDNIRKGFLETQSTVNKWVTNFKKKLDGEDDETFNSQPARPAQGFQGGNQGYSNYARRSSEMARRSADRERYDADPQVLSDDFANLELRDSEGKGLQRTPGRRSIQLTSPGLQPKKPQRPLANPNLFKPSSPSPSGRKVSVQNGPPDEIDDLYAGASKPSQQQGSSGKSSKWQPLSAVEPSPVAENDPFSLGDSDDDKETRGKEDKSDETGPLRIATAEAMAGSIGKNTKNEPGSTKDSGTRT